MEHDLHCSQSRLSIPSREDGTDDRCDRRTVDLVYDHKPEKELPLVRLTIDMLLNDVIST